eukprot:7651762-Prorocentrum_lima.AAC.1
MEGHSTYALTVGVGYAPHSGHPEQDRKDFFAALENLANGIPGRNYLALLLDANATLPPGTGGCQHAPN